MNSWADKNVYPLGHSRVHHRIIQYNCPQVTEWVQEHICLELSTNIQQDLREAVQWCFLSGALWLSSLSCAAMLLYTITNSALTGTALLQKAWSRGGISHRGSTNSLWTETDVKACMKEKQQQHVKTKKKKKLEMSEKLSRSFKRSANVSFIFCLSDHRRATIAYTVHGAYAMLLGNSASWISCSYCTIKEVMFWQFSRCVKAKCWKYSQSHTFQWCWFF